MDSREASLRHRLVEAVYLNRFHEAERHESHLRRLLADRAVEDEDLEIVRHWLDEQSEQQVEARARQIEAARRSRLKLVLTALPLVFAALLSTLLSIVLIWPP